MQAFKERRSNGAWSIVAIATSHVPLKGENNLSYGEIFFKSSIKSSVCGLKRTLPICTEEPQRARNGIRLIVDRTPLHCLDYPSP